MKALGLEVRDDVGGMDAVSSLRQHSPERGRVEEEIVRVVRGWCREKEE
jgi:hypothetical protein